MIRASSWQAVAIGGSIFMLLALLAMYPHEALEAASRGIAVWWEILFPALFPFFVMSELLFGYGVVHFFGMLLDPLMRPLFKVPGIGGFVMAMGFASGYPVAARIVSQLREQNLVSRLEAERLVSFASTSDPIFLIGAVAVGFFGNPQLAGILALAHYGGAAIVGLLLRYYGRDTRPSEPMGSTPQTLLMVRAFAAMHEARLRDRRDFGAVMRDSIQTSIRMIVVVGGLVVFFSVLLELFSIIHLLDVLSLAISSLLHMLNLPHTLGQAVVNGVFEVTLGAKAAGQAEGATLLEKTSVAAFVLAWSGLSVHAQIVSLLTRTDVRYAPFVVSRLLHGLLSSLIVVAAWPQFPSLALPSPASSPLLADAGAAYGTFAAGATVSFIWFCMLLAALLLLSLICRCFLPKV